MPVPFFQGLDSNGTPLAFGCVWTYVSGTTTPLTTYTDYTGTIANPNPVALNGAGAAGIWLQSGQAYTIAIYSNGGTNCALGTLIESVDGIGGGLAQTVTPVPSSTTPSFVVTSQIQVFTLTLTADTVALPVSFVNVQAPSLITFQISQDGVGSHTYTCPANVIGCATIDSAANHTTSQSFVWNGTTILPVGSGFTSNGDTSLPGNVISNNLYTANSSYSGTNTFLAVQDFNGIVDTTLGASLPTCTNGGKQLITTNCLATYAHTLCNDGGTHSVSANSTFRQVIGSCKIPAGAINTAGATFRFTAPVTVIPGGAGPPTSQAFVGYGTANTISSNFSSTASQGAASNAYTIMWTIDCIVTTPGSSGSASCGVSVTGYGVGSPVFGPNQQTITLDTTSDFYLGSACQFSAGSTSNTCNTNTLLIEQLN